MFSSPQENAIVNYSYSYCCCESGEDTLYSMFTDHLGSWKTVGLEIERLAGIRKMYDIIFKIILLMIK